MHSTLLRGLLTGIVLACACQAAPAPHVSDEASTLPLAAAAPCDGVWFGRACGDDGNMHVCELGQEIDVIECPYNDTSRDYSCSIDDWGQAYCTFVLNCARDSECELQVPDGIDLSCVQPICIDTSDEDPGHCEHPALRPRTPCRREGGMCDGSGHCVDCLEDADCRNGAQPFCYMNRCISG